MWLGGWGGFGKWCFRFGFHTFVERTHGFLPGSGYFFGRGGEIGRGGGYLLRSG